MMFCRIALVVMYVLAVGIELGCHGQRKEGYHNFWTTLIGAGIQFALLIGGGFFD